MNNARMKIRQAVETEFVALARRIFGEQLVSLVIYGSYLKDTFTPGVSDVNVLVILAKNQPEALAQLGAHGSRFLRRNKITPLILSRQEFVSSADVFPMESVAVAVMNSVSLLGSGNTTSKSGSEPLIWIVPRYRLPSPCPDSSRDSFA